MEIFLKDLLAKQLELDTTINELHQVSHATTKEERFLALLVEIGELANETRCFKYWSLKPSSAREILLDEYADGLHFLLSLGIVFGFDLDTVSYEEVGTSKKEVTNQFLKVYVHINDFHQSEKQKDFILLFKAFLQLGSALSFTSEDIRHAYLQKLVINYNRQNNNY